MNARTPLKFKPDQLTVAWQSASLLLDYPTEQTRKNLDLIEQATSVLPRKLSSGLSTTIEHLRARPLHDVQGEYVDTFDHRRRGCLFLTYFSNGETRKRGLALLRIKQTYLRAGLTLTEDQLPDHLCVVLEFAATTDQRAGLKIILDNRAGLELLRLHLEDVGSAWHGALETVCRTLPGMKDKDYEAVQLLAAEGPAEEQVGLSPYSMPEMAQIPGGV